MINSRWATDRHMCIGTWLLIKTKLTAAFCTDATHVRKFKWINGILFCFPSFINDLELHSDWTDPYDQTMVYAVSLAFIGIQLS